MSKRATSSSLVSTGKVADNRRARYDYNILSTIEAGVMLMGSEVKALRMGRAQLSDSYAGVREGELYLLNMQIADYPHAGKYFQHENKRPRKLLVKRRERDKLIGHITRDRMTLVPMQVYFNQRGIAKVKLGLAKGKKEEDKRETIKQRDWTRRKARILRGDE